MLFRSRGVEFSAAGEVGADLGDDTVCDADIGLVGQVGGDDGAVADGGGHGALIPVPTETKPALKLKIFH